jgi:hypothetical protein
MSELERHLSVKALMDKVLPPELAVPEVPKTVEIQEDYDSLKLKVEELRKNQAERRRTIEEIGQTIDQVSQTDQELNTLEKKVLQLLLTRLERL